MVQLTDAPASMQRLTVARTSNWSRLSGRVAPYLFMMPALALVGLAPALALPA